MRHRSTARPVTAGAAGGVFHCGAIREVIALTAIPVPSSRRPASASTLGRSPRNAIAAARAGEERPGAARQRVDDGQVAGRVAALEQDEVRGVQRAAAGHEGDRNRRLVCAGAILLGVTALALG